ncbi:hypothetical protein C2G38_2163502 [Gigaspora rosea]|uniref:Uncharacterized protein n=1 Tax=Gigaspora rosea TaxID=44941 RepID=A0A397VXA4_9GLOM|nr:hypothetical protein C2G38_2163502 [Gigaspora rosea]
MYKECIENSNLLQISPENLDVLRTRENSYCMLGKYQTKLDILLQALTLDRTRGQTYYMLGHYEESLADLDNSLKIDQE